MKTVKVNAGKGYNIFIEEGLLSQCGALIKEVTGAKKVCVISDSNVFPIYGETVKSQIEAQGFDVSTFVFEAGEESKTTSTVLQMVNFLADKGLTREDLVVALGGGVCGDMAGFAAAIYLRGIDFVQIPTTLLAQVDSSVGGKTAVDLPAGKNLCGAFHQPVLVIIDPKVLDSLPEKYYSDGMAEVIKYGCIKSLEFFERIENENSRDFIDELIYTCVDIKRQVVENDEKEKGERALLNFGHTAGHAIEKLWNFSTVSHGAAVGIGMVMITKAGEAHGITEKGTSERIASVLKKYNLPVEDSHDISQIVSAMQSDKKRTGDGIKLVMLSRLGESFIRPTTNKELLQLFGVNV